METVTITRKKHVFRHTFRLFTIIFFVWTMGSCFFSPDAYNDWFYSAVHPNVVDSIEFETIQHTNWNQLHIFDFQGTLYALSGDILYIIGTEPFEVIDSYEFPWGSDNIDGIKGGTDETGKMWIYFANSGDLYSINEEEHIIETEEGPYDILENFDKAVTYFAYNEQDYVAGWRFGEGVRIYNQYDGSLAVQIPLPSETMIVDTEFIGETFYIIYKPMVPSTSSVNETLTLTMKGFAAEDFSTTEDRIYDDWNGSVDLKLSDNTYYSSGMTYNNVQYDYSDVSARIIGNGLLVYNIEQVNAGLAKLIVYDLAGDRRLSIHSDWYGRRSACLSHTGEHYYMLTSEGVYKYRVP